MGPKIDPIPKPPVLIAETLDWTISYSFWVSGRPSLFSLAALSVRIIAGVELLLTRAPPTPASRIPTQRMIRSFRCSTSIMCDVNGAGPVRVMLTAKISRPIYYMRPYFFPLGDSLTKFRPIEATVYIIVSSEKMSPTFIVSTSWLASLIASTGSLKVKHMSESEMLMAIVQMSK